MKITSIFSKKANTRLSWHPEYGSQAEHTITLEPRVSSHSAENMGHVKLLPKARPKPYDWAKEPELSEDKNNANSIPDAVDSGRQNPQHLADHETSKEPPRVESEIKQYLGGLAANGQLTVLDIVNVMQELPIQPELRLDNKDHHLSQ